MSPRHFPSPFHSRGSSRQWSGPFPLQASWLHPACWPLRLPKWSTHLVIDPLANPHPNPHTQGPGRGSPAIPGLSPGEVDTQISRLGSLGGGPWEGCGCRGPGIPEFISPGLAQGAADTRPDHAPRPRRPRHASKHSPRSDSGPPGQSPRRPPPPGRAEWGPGAAPGSQEAGRLEEAARPGKAAGERPSGWISPTAALWGRA